MAVNQALIGLGGNLHNPVQQLAKAVDALKTSSEITVRTCSSLYGSLPQGPQDQDSFINAVVWIETALSPTALLQATQAIEQAFGRVKTRHWGERVIDLDILFFNQDCIQQVEPDLLIPHPLALTRDFVVLPALEIAPEWQLPDGSFLKDYISSCTSYDLQKIGPLPT